MKLLEYIDGLLELIKENPEAAEFEVIYSHDDEGNEFQKVHSNGTLVEVSNIDDERFLELIWDEESETNAGNPNAVIIN